MIFCYPAIRAITNYRIAHALYELKVPLLPRIITEMAHSETGIDIHPRARIGHSFTIDHGTGVVIGATSIIGNNVKIYQGVTLGAKSFPLDEQGNPIKGIERHPIVEDNVIIYAQATILGRITIGANSLLGVMYGLHQMLRPTVRLYRKDIVLEDLSGGWHLVYFNLRTVRLCMQYISQIMPFFGTDLSKWSDIRVLKLDYGVRKFLYLFATMLKF